jgi:glycosyltransferase involved in cell wall biosynthesis
MRITVGIHLYAEPEGLRATIEHLRAATPQPVEILLLPDGPDWAMRRALGGWREFKQSASRQPMGAAACFNRMLRESPADVCVFLESGALVGNGWLGSLLAALAADSKNGLAGPSTNRSWNMQAEFNACTETDIRATATLAETRFGGAWKPMEPLHCLADFCYVVRREVVDAIGGADEAYGTGPCWEMDYSVRASRAGFRGVWARSAFVYRRPATTRRQHEELRWFDASKRRYQDKFCGLRLSGERNFYVAHCEGDQCRHFAPAELIRLRQPLEVPAPHDAISKSTAASHPERTLVSCIMPTRNRYEWVMQSVEYFRRQDYPDRELIIIDDGKVDRGDELRGDPRIRYVHLTRQLSIGSKRNRACELARGTVIVHWDDDDWYAAGRLSAQVAPLISGQADITALADPCFFQLDRWEFWTCTTELYRRLFVRNVHGGTLAFRRHVFDQLARYPDASLAEDAAFLNAAVARGARLHSIPSDGLFVYLRHGGNAWSFSCGQYLDARGWSRVSEPQVLLPDRAFYAARSSAAAARQIVAGTAGVAGATELAGVTGLAGTTGVVEPAGLAGAAAATWVAPLAAAPNTAPTLAPIVSVTVSTTTPSLPLVSCIMPTYNRRTFVPKAIEYFLRQDYPHRELVILDDGDDRVADLIPNHVPSIRYIPVRERLLLGPKRNAAIEASQGDIIVHWDDDDWMDRSRIRTQVSALLDGGADICGTSKVWFYEIASGRVSIYQYPATGRRWLYGASLCYRRSLWKQKPFESLNIGEDTRFVWAPPVGRMTDLAGSRMLIAMVHRANTSSPRPLTGPQWRVWEQENARELLHDDWAFYQELAQSLKQPDRRCRRLAG